MATRPRAPRPAASAELLPGSPETCARPLCVLIIEDSTSYASLVTEMLADGLSAEVRTVHCTVLSAACELLRRHTVDAVLLDLSLPDAHRLEAVRAVQSAAPAVPVVVLTASGDPELGVEAVQAGAQDYLAKRSVEPELLARSIRYAVERKRAEVKLAEQSMRDSLTGLPNRVLLLDRLGVALARARRRPTSVAVLFLDLDRFKTVNDSLGHEAGDQLLVEIGSRLRSTLRPSDTVARFGGDEFLVLCEDLASEREAVGVAERALQAISAPMMIAGHWITIGASIGISVGGHPESGRRDLIRQADAAMYRAKHRGTGLEIFQADMRRSALSELETEHQLRAAIDRGELTLRFQPVVTVLGRPEVTAVEALVRWQHPERELLEPAEFIPLAERTGLIMPIGAWVLRTACRQLGAWRAAGVVADDLKIAVNLSLRQIERQDLVDTVADALAGAGLPPSRLCLEVTESCMAADPQRAVMVLRELKELGVSIALDDFGTGYSSLSTLSSYPIDYIKIDRSFIREGAHDAGAARMFAAVLGVARAAELLAVAEGVETVAQLQLLRRLGCECGQGFAISRPLTAEAFAAALCDGTIAAAASPVAAA